MASFSSTIEEKGRIFYFDVLRAIACVMVVLLHSSANYAIKQPGSYDFWVGHVFDSLARAGVPLFTMISGALLLDEKYAFSKSKWLAHIKKMIVFFLFWSSAYCVVFYVGKSLIKHESISLIRIIWKILAGHYHLWFVPMIIALYAILPLLRLWVKKENRRYVEYYLLLSLVFSFILPQIIQILVCINPVFDKVNSITDNLYYHYSMGFSSYFVLGWYLHNFKLKRTSLGIIMGMVGVSITIFATYVLFIKTETTEFVFYDNFSINVLLYASAIFVCIQGYFGRNNRKNTIIANCASLISKHSMGIYAIHVFVLAVLSYIFKEMTPLLVIPLQTVIATGTSMMVTVIIKKIPYLKHVV